MSHYLIEPRDPMVVRDGRPNRGSASSRTRDFPLPSALAGVVRTRLGSDAQGAFEMHEELASLRTVGVRGPLLQTIDEPGRCYVPAPLDAIVFEKIEGADVVGFELQALQPRCLPAGCRVDAEMGDAGPPSEGKDARDLMLLGLDREAPEGKASKRAPSFWSMDDVQTWLGARELERGCWKRSDRLVDLVDGLSALPRELRTHVAIGPEHTAREGMLFETQGLRLCVPSDSSDQPDPRKELQVARLGLAFRTQGLEGRELRTGLFPFAGERRLMFMREAESAWPELPAALLDHVKAGDRSWVRLLLLTPALFEGGFLPGSSSPMLAPRDGLELRMLAARTPSPMVVSGWDMAKRRPKPSRRAVPAGAVYWLELRGSADAREAWAREVWMKNVSCEAQDRLDGWGLAMLGVADRPGGGS